MKVFVIPSWYPSDSNPIYGTFVKEQIVLMAHTESDLTFGVSLWGQGDDRFLIYSKQPIQSIKKLKRRYKQYDHVHNNIHTYFSPAYTWTKKILNGNLKGIIAANLANLDRFISIHGKPDVIHAQASYPAAWVAETLASLYQIPYVVTLRMSPFPFQEFLNGDKLKPSLYKVLSNASLLIATSHSLKKRVQSFGITHVQVVHNPIDLTLFQPGPKSSSSANFQLLAVGRLEAQKGFDILIRAMSKLPSVFNLQIIGEGSQRQKLERMISDLKLQDRVSLLGEGHRKAVSHTMQKAQGYVLSSRHETFGNVLLEAMAVGLPSVATRCGGPEDIINPSCGILCDPDSVSALVTAIQNLKTTVWDSTVIRQQAVDRFSPAQFTSEMIDVYQSVVRRSA